MTKKGGGVYVQKVQNVKIKRKGIHAKSKTSLHKSSKHYIKLKVGQG